MALQLRRGSNADRLTTTFAEGEPVWTTDTNKLFVGDGVTPGAVAVGSDQFLNTTSNVTFNSALISTTATVATLKFGDGTTMTTAPVNEANQSLNTNSNVTFADLTVTNQLSIGNPASSQLSISKSGAVFLVGSSNSSDSIRLQNHNYLYLNPTSAVIINEGTPAQSFLNVNTIRPAGVYTAVTVASTLTITGNATANSIVTQDLVSSGGFPLNDNGVALIRASSTQTPAMVVSNYTAGLLPEVVVRGYGQNRPGGPVATTIGAAGVVVESSRGTHTAPTVPGVGDVIASLSAGSYDGTRWSSDMNIYPAQIIATAAETWAGNATTTTNAGSRLEMWVQPPAVQLNSTSRFRPMRHVWTAGNVGTGTPPILNIHEGSGQDGAPTLTPASGTGSFGTGSGRVNLVKTNTLQQIFGVPTEDTTADNPSLKGTNGISFISGRRSGVVGRRNKLLNNDTIGTISFAGQTADNSAGTGASVGYFYVSAAEDFSPTAAGSSMSFGTANVGTNAGAVLRLRLNSSQNTHNSNGHDFLDNLSNPIASLTTSSAYFSAPIRQKLQTSTVARGGTYTLPANDLNVNSLEITAGTAAITYIDVDNVATDATSGGMYSILIYNNSGDNNISVQVRNNATAIGAVKLLDNGQRAMASVYVVDGYAACEIMDAA